MSVLKKKPFGGPLAFLVALVVSVSTVQAESVRQPTAGPLILGHQMEDLAGKPVSLSGFQGQVLVVNFWASWCAPCRRELPLLDRWNTEWQGTGARVVAISIDSRGRNASRFVTESGLQLTAWLDGPKGLARDLDLPAIPTTYVLDRDGKVVFRIAGSSDLDLARLHAVVENLIKSSDERPGA